MLLEDSKEEVGAIKGKYMNKTNCLYVNKTEIYTNIHIYIYIQIYRELILSIYVFKLPHPNIETSPTLLSG